MALGFIGAVNEWSEQSQTPPRFRRRTGRFNVASTTTPSAGLAIGLTPIGRARIRLAALRQGVGEDVAVMGDEC